MKSKHLLLMLLIALIAPWAANAQETLTVYNGTDNNSYVPFYGLYADDGVKCEFVIPADQLDDMTNGTISAMKFYLKSVGSNTITPSFTVFVKEVDFTTLTALTGTTGATTVFNNTITFTNNTAEVEIDLPFSSNYSYGGGNLLIGIYQDAALGSGNYSSTYWYGVNQSGSNTAWSGSGSGSARQFLPKTTFTYTPGAAPSCPKPTNLTVSNVTSSNASFSWTKGGDETEWVLEYSTASNFTNAVPVPRSGIPAIAINDFAPATTYYAHVKALCGSDDESNWSNVVTFTTPCDAYSIPYTYGFEETAPFDCWTPIAGVTRQTSYVNNGSYSLKFSGTTSNMIALPQFNEATNNLRVEFWTRPESATNSSCGTFSVGYMTDITDASTFVEVENYAYNDWTSATYIKKTVDFIDAPASANIAFRHNAGSSSWYWFADDVTVKEIPSCVAPTALAADASTTSAELSWTANSNENTWTLYWKKTTDETYTEVPGVDENPYLLRELDAASNYQFYVVANCSADDASEPSEVLTFTTECDVIAALGYSENFDSYTVASAYTAPSARVLPNCWNAINTTTYSTYSVFPTIYYYSSTNYANSTPNSLKFYSYYSSYGSYDPQPQYAILPEMEGLAGTQVQLMARGYNANSTFKIGTMSDPTDASTFTMIAEQTLTTSYPAEAYEYIIPTDCRDNYLAIMIDAASSSRASNGVYIDDIAIVEAPSCLKPTELAVTANSITYDGAVITWTAGASETQWQIEFSKNSDFSNPLYETVQGEPTYTFHGLDESTTYYVHVQAVCGGSNGSSEYSTPVSFSTLQTPTNLPYTTDFESGNDWLLVNGDLTNAWAYGTATSNGEGSHAIYISNDGGTTNAYTINSAAMVYATKLFNFEDGIYVFSYDWKTYGETYSDYLRVALVPASVTLTAGTTMPTGFGYSALPTGWIALDGGGKLNLQTEWQSFTSDEMEVAAGSYMMVFAWRDDTSVGTNPPAAIDNVSIAKITCTTPTNFDAPDSGITATSAQLIWTETGEATAWEIELTDENDNVSVIPVTEDDLVGGFFTIEDLTSETIYSAKVRANCGDGYSNWSEEAIFETAEECQTPDGLAATTTSNSATISWNGYGQEEFNLRYSTDGETWTTERGVANNYMLADLTPVTTYYVQVQPTCADEETWSESYSFTTECDVITIAQDAAYTYDFENETPWTCWTNVAGSNILSSGSNNTTGGSYKLQFKGTTTGNIVAMPAFTPDINGLMLTFWTRPESYSYSLCGTFSVGYMTDLDDASTFVPVATYSYNDWTSNTYIEKKVAFTSAPAGAYIAFCQNAGATNYYWYVDDVTVEIAPSFTLDIDGYADNDNPDGGYYLIASPLNEAINPTNVGGMITDSYDLYRFNQGAALEWENYLTHTNDFVLEPGKGYLYASEEDTQLVFIGAPYSGNGEVTLTRAEEGEGIEFPGMNLVGNPFADEAYITDRPFYVMDGNGETILPDAPGSSYAIQPMEGVFVDAEQDGDIVTFTTEAPGAKANIVLNLTQGRGRTIDRAIVSIGQGRTLPKFMLNPDDTKLYMPQNGEDYAVVRGSNSGDIPVSFEPAEDGSYIISVDVRNMNLRTLTLKDKVRNVSIDLLRTPNYQFRASIGDRADRFVLSFRTNSGIYKEKIVKGANPEDFGFFNNGNWIIDNEGEATLQVIDLNGRVLSSENIYGSTSIQVDAAPGVYMLRLVNGDNVKTQKVVVK